MDTLAVSRHSSLGFAVTGSILLVAGLLAIGCGPSGSTGPSADAPGASNSITEVTVSETEQSSEPAILTIAPTTITAEGDDGALVIEDDGTVVINGVFVGKMHGDGRITNKDGKQVASIDANGLVTIDNFPESFTIAEDGSIDFEGRTLAIGEDGALVGLGPAPKVIFAVPEEGRRAAMLAFVLAMVGGGASQGPQPAPAPESSTESAPSGDD